MTSPHATSHAQEFRRLHTEGLLLLTNAWDPGSARLMESLGSKAVATTSAGVAWAHGYADGNHLPVQLMAATVAGITRVIRVPLTVDMEGGYSDDPAAVGEAVATVLDAGAVGINIEDGSGTPDLLCAKIEQVKRTGARLGVDVFVNARTDVYLRGLAPKGQQVQEALARGERYRAAGADGLFVPGVVEASEIRAIVSGTKLPVNVMARPNLPSLSELQALGVRRLSAGSSISEAVFGRAASLARAFLREGAAAPLKDGALPYPELNALMTAR
ncbi:isocitrate lyase/phosphoenolpyruvate mutase family protein [Pyxidicoccus fallax]|uniref:Isocitrate lyase/phosphoenolpyruvate mutase family protein n=1 Tax=Pyxidicoccus fallax TaxID=394095 RepID=A0A848LRS6_9BACT|nr:isocitrate lyase/phosphoenolpyruvate mutase family protein [Pyxidicoccus fallax]NMO20456.1 isocitrate lyase/phosphoenolpyruvate mutase family protein [Pyxidicoccus fallax]NPC84387.1 isocitrate lyase/phosphoenolpyruvate mutase family protein [Pyxidicoccus fallax]